MKPPLMAAGIVRSYDGGTMGFSFAASLSTIALCALGLRPPAGGLDAVEMKPLVFKIDRL